MKKSQVSFAGKGIYIKPYNHTYIIGYDIGNDMGRYRNIACYRHAIVLWLWPIIKVIRVMLLLTISIQGLPLFGRYMQLYKYLHLFISSHITSHYVMSPYYGILHSISIFPDYDQRNN